MNRTFIIGNVCSEPTMNTTKNGKAVCNFRFANNEHVGGKDRATYYKVTAWEKNAENCYRYLKTGRKAMLEGYVSASAYLDKDGTPRANLEFNLMRIEFLTPKEKGEDGSSTEAESGGFTPVNDPDLPY